MALGRNPAKGGSGGRPRGFFHCEAGAERLLSPPGRLDVSVVIRVLLLAFTEKEVYFLAEGTSTVAAFALSPIKDGLQR